MIFACDLGKTNSIEISVMHNAFITSSGACSKKDFQTLKMYVKKWCIVGSSWERIPDILLIFSHSQRDLFIDSQSQSLKIKSQSLELKSQSLKIKRESLKSKVSVSKLKLKSSNQNPKKSNSQNHKVKVCSYNIKLYSNSNLLILCSIWSRLGLHSTNIFPLPCISWKVGKKPSISKLAH